MKISKGKIKHAYKVVIYGPEGVGKTSLAAKFPDPVFIDTEGGTFEYDVNRFDEVPSSWSMLLSQVQYVIDNPNTCKTLVIDTADWAETLCVRHVCAKSNTSEDGIEGIEKFGYGKGYRYAADEFGRLINKLSDVIEKGINVVVTAHAAMRKFEQPNETGAYDRWELKLINTPKCSISALLKEWADCVLFATFKINTVSVSDDGKKKKAVGRGQRVMYTSHHACWDAKNRFGLPEELPLDYSQIAHIFSGNTQPVSSSPRREAAPPKPAADPPAVSAEPTLRESVKSNAKPKEKEEAVKPPVEDAGEQITLSEAAARDEPASAPPGNAVQTGPDPHIPKALRDLMIANNIFESDIQAVVSDRGYYPFDVRIKDYDPGFIDGVLVGAWSQVLGMIQQMKSEPTPFDN